MALKKNGILLFGLAVALVFFLVEKNIVRAISSRPLPAKNLTLLETVIRYIRNDYIEEKNPLQTFEGSFKGMVNSLDSYSSYLNRESTARFLSQKDSLLKEPGLIIYKRYDSFPVVVGLIENSPAEKNGLKLGDSITEINGLSTPAMSMTEFNLTLKDKEGVPIDLKILRGDKTLEMKVERALLAQEPVAYSPQEGLSGVLKIARLESPCVNLIKTKLLPALRKKQKALVIDLRNCQEGTFEEAQQLIGLFTKVEQMGYIEKKGGSQKRYSSLEEPLLPQIPLVIWINQATIGPAEAVSAVLKESQRAKVVGLPTLGLAAEQELFPIEDGSSLLLTTGIFCLNSGEKLWDRGAAPDVVVESADQSFAAYLKKTQSLLLTP